MGYGRSELDDEPIEALDVVARTEPVAAAERGQAVQCGPEHLGQGVGVTVPTEIRILPTDEGGNAHSITRQDLARLLVVQVTSDEHLSRAVTLANR